jgi:hypothetical protein
MKDAQEKIMAQAKPREGTESPKRLAAKATLQKALDSMARLRVTIDRRPGRLMEMRKTAGR